MGQLTDGLNALIRYANEVTGGSDTTISGAVSTLVAGYGQGGDDDTGLPLVSEVRLAIPSYAFYDTFNDFLDAYAPHIVRGDGYFYAIIFSGNSSTSRAGKRAVVWARNSWDCLMIERVGYSGTDLAYGVDVYAGCTLIIRKYQMDLNTITSV